MEKLLSVIIPSYNSQKFLDVGIPTFLDLNVLDALDVIIVNDGSTDGTAAAAEKYCAMYPDSIRLINQVNKGHGGALNTGFSAAVGKYLRVVDADDWIQTECLAPFLEFLRGCSSDVVLNHYRTVDISNGQIKERRLPQYSLGKTMTMAELMEDRIAFEQLLALHGITYRTDFYREKGIQLTEHVFYEDVEYSTIPCCFAETISCVDCFLYEYRIGDVQQSVSDSSQLKRIGHVEKVLDRLLKEYDRVIDQLDMGQNRYYCTKTRSLLLRYCSTALLLEPDRKKGRQLAADMVELFRMRMPQVYSRMYLQYDLLILMNLFRISKQKWDRFLQSKFYQNLRKNYR